MSWNIHGGIGRDGVFDLERIAATIRRHDPDILALQEIDTRGRDVNCLRPLHALHEAAGHWRDARTIDAPDGHYGHALLSRWPLRALALHDLSFRRREPRCAIDALIDTPMGALHVLAVHLGLNLAERRAQACSLRELAQVRRGLATVALGDFNDWFAFGTVRRTLRQVLPARTRLATYPACHPLLRLDRIYTRDRTHFLRVWSDRLAANCSDHLPVLADMRFAATDETPCRKQTGFRNQSASTGFNGSRRPQGNT